MLRAIMERKKIGEILIEEGLITSDQLNIALTIQERDNNGLLGTNLLLLDYINPEQLLSCLDLQRNINKKD
jgi:type IV pilus assembly protein PilB